MAIIQKDGHRAVQPGGGNYDVGEVVAIEVASAEFESSRGAGNAKGLSFAGGKLKAYPVTGLRKTERTSLHSGQISLLVAIEVGDGEMGV